MRTDIDTSKWEVSRLEFLTKLLHYHLEAITKLEIEIQQIQKEISDGDDPRRNN